MDDAPVLYETHSHTPLCRHAWGEPEDYARVAGRRGLRGIIVTCHNPMPDNYSAGIRMSVADFPGYVKMVARASEAMAGKSDVRLGLECDYYPGAEYWLERQLASAPFDYVLGSIHPHVPEYRRVFDRGTALDFQLIYFDHLAMAAETGLFDCLAHPDLIKNYAPSQWRPQSILDHIRSSLDRIAGSGTAMELNTSGAYKEFPEMNPGQMILHEMRERDIPVVIGADAHSPDRVGEGYENALKLLKSIGYETVNVFLNRRRFEIPIDRAYASLRSFEHAGALR